MFKHLFPPKGSFILNTLFYALLTCWKGGSIHVTLCVDSHVIAELWMISLYWFQYICTIYLMGSYSIWNVHSYFCMFKGVLIFIHNKTSNQHLFLVIFMHLPVSRATVSSKTFKYCQSCHYTDTPPQRFRHTHTTPMYFHTLSRDIYADIAGHHVFFQGSKKNLFPNTIQTSCLFLWPPLQWLGQTWAVE